jgi:hypothetical protein
MVVYASWKTASVASRVLIPRDIRAHVEGATAQDALLVRLWTLFVALKLHTSGGEFILHRGQPNPQQDPHSKSAQPVDLPDQPKKVREHQALRHHPEQLPGLPFLQTLGKGGAHCR